MKKSILTTLIVLFALSWINAQTEGVLTVTTTTGETGGNYAPKNVVAIWIEDTEGNFIKTLLAYAAARKTHLNTWEASTTAAGSPFNTTDAISGATRPSHSTRTCTWNSMDFNGNLAPDGVYRVRMELTDKNSTGNFSTFTFMKGIDAENQMPTDVPSFSSIIINWQPVFTSVEDPAASDGISIWPNPTSRIFNISGRGITGVEIRNASGELIDTVSSPAIDISSQPDGIYLIKITTAKGTVTKKLLKKGL